MPPRKTKIQLYADECFPITSVTYLKSLGYSIVHAYDKNLIRRSDITHLQTAHKLKRTLITLDRDFLGFENVNFNQHPGVIVISTGSATFSNVNKVCRKFLKLISKNFTEGALIRVSVDKIVKMKNGKVVFEKEL